MAAGSTEALPSGQNPYVGPRPFVASEKIYGRETEIVELSDKLLSERIVVLHSPSGAGKTSLINAGLIPRMRRHFDVWQPTRVHHQPPEGLAVANRYAWSAALGLEQEVPEDRRRPASHFANLTLQQYYDERLAAPNLRRKNAPNHILLIFDQFEEVLRVDALGITTKEAFFDQLGELLHTPQIWALFVLREDYLAPLDPYASRVPTSFARRYRIDRLDKEAAAAAIEGVTEEEGVYRKWSLGVIPGLAADLARVKVQQPDGGFEYADGIHVEPLQLQVVCFSLWERMDRIRPDDLSIDPEDLEKFGDVSDALSVYYETKVADAAGGDVATERKIRDWVSSQLITPDLVRCPVLKGRVESAGLSNDLISKLEDDYLVRAEERGGAK